MADGTLALFALEAVRPFGERVAAALGVPLAAHEEREFEDGEHKARPLVNVRSRDVFVLHSLYGEPGNSANDKLCRLLFFLGALRDASAARVTAVVPYLAYARKDARTQPRDPLTTRYVAQLFEAVGVDRVVALEVHNPVAFHNAFRCRAEHLDTARLFAEHFAAQFGDAARIAVVSPDIGGVKRVARFRQALARQLGREPGMAFFEKTRGQGVLRTGRLVGDVAGCRVLVLDDIIGTGHTLVHAAHACREAGATGVVAAAAHGVFCGDANETLNTPALDAIAVTDSIPPFRLAPELVRAKLTIVTAAGLVAEAIRRLHDGGSLVELLQSP